MKHRLLLMSLILIVCFCGGCWNIDEINKRAIVLIMGLDTAPEDKVKVSLQIPIAENTFSPLIGGGASSEKTFYVVSQTAESVFATTTGLQSKTNKDLFYGQLKVLVINTEIARRGLLEVIDFTKRHPGISPQMVILLTKEKAEDILKAELSSKESNAFAIRDFFLSPDKYNAVYSLHAWQILCSLVTGFEDVFLPFIEYDPQEQNFNIQGIGVFDRGRLVGELTALETRMFGLMTGRVRNAYPFLSFGKKELGTFRGVTARSQINIESGDDPNHPLTFLIKVRARGFLVELTSGKARFKINDIKYLQKKTEKALRNEMTKTLRHLQQLNSDILGFGELLRAKRPKVWSKINWEQEFPRVQVKLDIKFRIERTGTYR